MTSVQAIEHLLGIEGGYSNHADDPGGMTQWGITEVLAREHGYDGPMTLLPLWKAREIYERHFWQFLRCDALGMRSEKVQWEVFEIAVNGGRLRAGEYLQTCLNAFNYKGNYWLDIAVDGYIGARTLRAYEAMYDRRGQEGMAVLEAALEALMAGHYLYLSRVNPNRFESFTYGWFLQRIVND